jgi:hypothetical protein
MQPDDHDRSARSSRFAVTAAVATAPHTGLVTDCRGRVCRHSGARQPARCGGGGWEWLGSMAVQSILRSAVGTDKRLPTADRYRDLWMAVPDRVCGLWAGGGVVAGWQMDDPSAGWLISPVLRCYLAHHLLSSRCSATTAPEPGSANRYGHCCDREPDRNSLPAAGR